MKGAVSAVLAVVLAVQSGPSTSLRLSFRGPDGETIRPDRVTLLLDWWGGGEALRLSVNATDVVVNLDPNNLRDGGRSSRTSLQDS